MTNFWTTLIHGHYSFWPLPRAGGVQVRISAFLLFLMALGAVEAVLSAIFGFNANVSSWRDMVVRIWLIALMPFQILAHESGHILAARKWRQHATVTVLQPLGGTTRLVGPVPTPRREALIALAGPAASLILVVAAFLAMLCLPSVGEASAEAPGGAWHPARLAYDLAYSTMFVQFILLLANLFPMTLLDGGRVALAACVGGKGAETGWRWAENISLVGLIAAVALCAWGREYVEIVFVGLIYWAGLRFAEDRRMTAWALDHARHGTAANRDTVTGGDYFFGASSLGSARVLSFADAAPRRPGWWARRRAARREAKAARRLAAAARAERGELAALLAEEDRLLGKIKTEGLGALTDAERETLARAAAWRREPE